MTKRVSHYMIVFSLILGLNFIPEIQHNWYETWDGARGALQVRTRASLDGPLTFCLIPAKDCSLAARAGSQKTTKDGTGKTKS